MKWQALATRLRILLEVRKMFNFGLYKEGLRRTKVFGIIAFVFMLLGAILVPIMRLHQHANMLRWPEHQRLWLDPVMTIQGSDVTGLPAVVALFAAPLLVLLIFAFLNNRNSSDFYHAIPHKRETLFTSFLAAVLTWTVITMWVTSFITTVIYAVSSHTTVNYGSILIVLFGFTVMILLVISGVILAMTFTGTTLSNLATALLILFFPRSMMAIFTTLVADGVGIINHNSFGIFSDHGRNLLFGIPGGLNWHLTLSNQMLHGMLYSFVLAMIYLLGACYLFKKRHSEVATHPGTKYSQPITRVIVAFIITLPVIFMILSPWNNLDLVGVVVIYVIAIVAYYAYEFITTRKIGSFWQMSKGLIVVMFLNLLFVGAVRICWNVILREIDINQVTVVEFASVHNNSSWQISYAVLHQQGLVINDSETVMLLAETLNQQIQWQRQNSDLNSWRWSSGIQLTFVRNGRSNITRILRINDQDGGWLLQELFRNYEPYLATYLLVPTEFDHVRSWNSLTQTQYEHILAVLRDELQTVDINAWYERVGRFTIQHSHDLIYDAEIGAWVDEWSNQVFTQLWVQGEFNSHRFGSSFPLVEELTPQTLALYRQYLGR